MSTLLQFLGQTYPIWSPPLAAFVGWLARRWWGDKRWWQEVNKLAYAVLADPSQTNDAKEAVAKAVIGMQVDRLAAEAAKVEKAFLMNGSNKVPKLEIDLEELK